jgi:hypothetical protein
MAVDPASIFPKNGGGNLDRLAKADQKLIGVALAV